MRPGPEGTYNWVYGDCYPATGLIETPSPLPGAANELSLYAFENHWSQRPTVLRRYTVRLDGFAAMSAGYGERTIVTVPLSFTGNRMELNFSTSARGYVRITVRADEKELRSCELFGDSVRRVVPFEGDLAPFAGRKVTLEFAFRDAEIFSFRFFS